MPYKEIGYRGSGGRSPPEAMTFNEKKDQWNTSDPPPPPILDEIHDPPYQVANKTGLSSLSIFQETRWLVCSLLKSVSLALKVAVKCCKSNYLR